MVALNTLRTSFDFFKALIFRRHTSLNLKFSGDYFLFTCAYGALSYHPIEIPWPDKIFYQESVRERERVCERGRERERVKDQPISRSNKYYYSFEQKGFWIRILSLDPDLTVFSVYLLMKKLNLFNDYVCIGMQSR